jgi:hypothetical protein
VKNCCTAATRASSVPWQRLAATRRSSCHQTFLADPFRDGPDFAAGQTPQLPALVFAHRPDKDQDRDLPPTPDAGGPPAVPKTGKNCWSVT